MLKRSKKFLSFRLQPIFPLFLLQPFANTQRVLFITLVESTRTWKNKEYLRSKDKAKNYMMY